MTLALGYTLSTPVAIAAHAAASGLHLATIVADEPQSAALPLQKRPRGSQLVRQLRHGDADGLVLIAPSLTAFATSAHDGRKWLEEWIAAGVSVILLDLGAAPVGPRECALLAACSTLEAVALKDRDVAKRLRRRQRPPHPGRPLYGYDVDGHPHPDEQACIGAMLECADRGLTHRWGIGRELYAMGFAPRAGSRNKILHHTLIAKTLARTRRDPSRVRQALDALAEWRARRSSEAR